MPTEWDNVVIETLSRRILALESIFIRVVEQ